MNMTNKDKVTFEEKQAFRVTVLNWIFNSALAIVIVCMLAIIVYVTLIMTARP